MSELRTVTYRLLPSTKAKARSLLKTAGACRYVWNHFLALQDETYQVVKMYGGKSKDVPYPSFFTLGKEFRILRDQTPWLKELSFSCVRYVLKYQAEAWREFFKGQSGKPCLKTRGRSTDSFTIPHDVVIKRSKLRIPKTGWCILRRKGGNPCPEGKPKQAVIRRICDKWYCAVFYEVNLPEKMDDGTAIGVDRNVGQIATSTGHIVRLPDISRLEARKRRYQRMMVRQRKGSNRRDRTKLRLRKTCRRIATIRQDWHHQASRMLADSASEIVLENLNVKGMSSSAKGTVNSTAQTSGRKRS